MHNHTTRHAIESGGKGRGNSLQLDRSHIGVQDIAPYLAALAALPLGVLCGVGRIIVSPCVFES